MWTTEQPAKSIMLAPKKFDAHPLPDHTQCETTGYTNAVSTNA